MKKTASQLASGFAIDQEAFDALIDVFQRFSKELDFVPEAHRFAAAGHLTIAFCIKARGKPCEKCGRMDNWLDAVGDKLPTHACVDSPLNALRPSVRQRAGDSETEDES